VLAAWARGLHPAAGEGTTVRSRAALGHDDHGHDAEVFYLGLVLDPKYVEGCALRGSGRTTRTRRAS